MTVLEASFLAAASLARRAGGARSREAAASRRAWLRDSMDTLRRLFSSQRTSGIAKNALAYACAMNTYVREHQRDGDGLSLRLAHLHSGESQCTSLQIVQALAIKCHCGAAESMVQQLCSTCQWAGRVRHPCSSGEESTPGGRAGGRS